MRVPNSKSTGWRTLVCTLTVSLLALTGAAQAGDSSMTMPEWDSMFDQHGFLTLDRASDLDRARFSAYGLNRAEFLQENISGGKATDMTALLPGENIPSNVVFNGPVSLVHDLGNAAVAFSTGAFGTEHAFATVERVPAGKSTFVEFELLQHPVSLGIGDPWPLTGARIDGDIKAVMHFRGNVMKTIEIMRFEDGAYALVENQRGSRSKSCGSASTVVFCTGLAPFSVAGEMLQVWDDDYQPLQPIRAQERIEIGIDTQAISAGLTFDSLIIRTPEDLVLSRTALTLADGATRERLK